MLARWPKQRRVVAQLRDILRREFGCQDAWVVVSGGRCRLEVHVAGRRVMLLEDAEDSFWARFYMPVQRERMHLGERLVETQIWRRPVADLIAVLTPHWHDRIGSRRQPGAEQEPDA
jgi:DNA primase catalytic subunit